MNGTTSSAKLAMRRRPPKMMKPSATAMPAALTIMFLNAEKLQEVVALIFRSAFGAEAAFGAVLGLAVEWGVKRGIYSNEAGQGTGPHSAAAAEVSHPAKQGYVQAFSIYVDTLLVCSATAFIILSTGMYNVVAPAGGMIVSALPGIAPGQLRCTYRSKE